MERKTGRMTRKKVNLSYKRTLAKKKKVKAAKNIYYMELVITLAR